VARKYTRVNERKRRRRHERFVRLNRRFAQFTSFVTSEFRVWIVIGITLTVIASMSVLLFAPFFDVRQIHVRRQDPRVDPEEVQQILSPLFNQRLVLVTRSQISDMLEAVYPDITDVTIAKEYPSTLTVSIVLEPVIAELKIVESDAPKLASESGAVLATGSGSAKYSYITERGVFFSTPIRLTKQKMETLEITDWSIRPQDRTELLSPLFLKTIFLARDTLRRDFGLEAQRITIYLRAKEFHIKTPKVTLWFDLRSDLPVQFQRFREFLKALSLDQAKEYIDLRIADKIVYK
jgi:cell division septal protein FtsQ